MKVVSLFSGIGGLDLGAEEAGLGVVAHVERDEKCRKLLALRFPGIPALDDVCTAGRDNLPACDILTGGWPCQDLSVAGRRAGLAGARSGLFYQFSRIAHELQPTYLVWENVPGLLNSDDGRDMLRVVTEFQRIGYCGAWRTLDAQYLGVAQRRRRVFGVFARADIGARRCAEILSLSEGVRGHPAPRREAREEIAGTLGGCSPRGGFRADLDGHGAYIPVTVSDGVANTLRVPSHGATWRGDGCDNLLPITCGTVTSKWTKGTGGPAGDECRNLVAFTCKDDGGDADLLAPTLRAMNYADSHLNGGGQVAIAFKPSFYTRGKDGAPSEVVPPLSADADKGDQEAVIVARRVVRRLTPRECERLQGFPDDWTAGFSDSHRYRMLGNAVAVPVARWIFKRLAATAT